MRLGNFKGGVHLDDGKYISKDEKLEFIKPVGEFAFILPQHNGNSAKAIVNVGDKVKKGQLIACADENLCAPIYSSIDGIVEKIEERVTPCLKEQEAIVVSPSDEQGSTMLLSTKNSIDDWNKDEILNRIKEAGITDMDERDHLVYSDLIACENKDIKLIIVNGAECEPYITCDYRRMLENSKEIVEGLKILLKCFPNAKGIIGIGDDKEDCINKLQDIVKDELNIHILSLNLKYPQGFERQLVQSVTHKKINRKQTPMDVGCIILNIESIYAIYNAVIKGEPVINRTITLSGDAIANPKNYIVPIGMNYKDIVDFAGGFKSEPAKIISGGPMMGTAIEDLNITTTKSSSAILAFTSELIKENKRTVCTKCGRCVNVCPINLIPSKFVQIFEKNKQNDFELYNGVECIECGCCNYVCPSNIPIKQMIASLKDDIENNSKHVDNEKEKGEK